ncbi:MAG: calcium/sodium antiporter [Clostridia bacterium]|nr:calcium/sodium antiporter [Clostridia bacterium]
MDILIMVVCLIGGFVLLVKGADFFVDGACAISEKLRIPAYVVGLTVVAFGTSLPEAAVSITASIQHSNEIAIGNVIGSNIFNTLVVLGASALLAPVAVRRDIIRRDFPFCIIITVLLPILIMTLNGGNLALTRIDGIILLIIFAAFMTYSVIAGKKQAALEVKEENEKKPISTLKCILYVVLGLAGVIIGGELTVYGAKELALKVGLSENVVALTVVAIGTSLPELVTSIVASRKGQNDIAVGNVIGSNIFNILFILGMSATIGNIGTDMNGVIDTCVLVGIMLVTFIFTLSRKKIGRAEGAVMILIYAAYTAYLLMRSFGVI